MNPSDFSDFWPEGTTPIYSTQGGGSAYYSSLQLHWLFWEVPSWMNGEQHSQVPSEWGIGPYIGEIEQQE